MKESEKQTI